MAGPLSGAHDITAACRESWVVHSTQDPVLGVRLAWRMRFGLWPLVWGSLVCRHFQGLLSICSKSSRQGIPDLGGDHFLLS
jgi:hypothetical protein